MLNGEFCTEISTRKRLAALTDRVWLVGQTLTVGFLDRRVQANYQDIVATFAVEWTRYANIEILFTQEPDNAVVRITNYMPEGNWSFIGRDALTENRRKPTMNLSCLWGGATNQEIRRAVLHEFGHALGLIHEHQNPVGGIQWNEPAVLKFYREQFGWDDQQTRENIISRYAADQVKGYSFDPKSIMMYPIPAELTLDGFHTEWNTELSLNDKLYVASVYPKKGEADVRSPTGPSRPADSL